MIHSTGVQVANKAAHKTEFFETACLSCRCFHGHVMEYL